MKKLKAIVVGAGIYGKHHLNAYNFNQDVELVGLCEVNEQLGCSVAAEYNIPVYDNLKDLFENIEVDIVSVATPDPFHFDPVMESIRAAKHVLIEKPMATTVKECQEIIAVANEKNVKIGVDYHKRWDGMAQHIHHRIKSGESGKVIRGYMSMDDVIDVPRNWLSWSASSSPVHFLGSHCFDLIRYYMDGAIPESVFSLGQKGILVKEGIDTWDTIQTMVTFKNGAQWTVETGWVLPDTFPKANDGRSFILTENDYFRADAQLRGYEVFGNNKAATPNYNFINYNNGRATGYGIQPIHDFVDHVLNDTPYLATAEDGLWSTVICEAAHESLSTGKRIFL